MVSSRPPGGATTSSVMRLPSRPSKGQESKDTLRGIGWRGLFAIDQADGGKGRAVHFQLAHHDAQNLLKHFIFVDGGVDLP